MGYNRYSITGFSDKDRERMQQIAKENALREQQKKELERAMKAKLKAENEHLLDELRAQYKLLDHEDLVLKIQRKMENDASGKAKKAIQKKIKLHLRMTMGTNMTWGQFSTILVIDIASGRIR